MEATIIITNSHPHGFSFGHAVDPINEQVFIPIHVAEGISLSVSDIIKAVLVPNYADKSDNGTAYMAVKILEVNDLNLIAPALEGSDPEASPAEAEVELAVEPEQEMSREETDALVLAFISETTYCTTSEISESLGLSHTTAGNSAIRAFVGGKISKAEVHGKVGQRRPSFVMWAKDASRFIDYA
tara:strand:+ start:894 stop:1448 length:555 start_codon:yes stop_codon:yes gene_type:complete